MNVSINEKRGWGRREERRSPNLFQQSCRSAYQIMIVYPSLWVLVISFALLLSHGNGVEIKSVFLIERIKDTNLDFCLVLKINSKAYIPLRRENTRVGPSCWAIPPTREFCVWDTNMLISKNAKICVTPNTNAKICDTPNANRWIIGSIGSPTQNSRIGHVDFMLFVSLSLALRSQREHNFQWIFFFFFFNSFI